VPVKDPLAGFNRNTGSYPFRLDGGYNTVLHLKNTTDKTVYAVAQIRYEGGGTYNPDQIKLEPFQTGAALLERWLAAEKSGVAPNRQYQSGSCVVDMNCEIAYLTTKRNPLYDSLRCGSRTGSGKCLSVGSRAIQFYHHSTALRAGTTDDS
jgi:hypothetical protein